MWKLTCTNCTITCKGGEQNPDFSMRFGHCEKYVIICSMSIAAIGVKQKYFQIGLERKLQLNFYAKNSLFLFPFYAMLFL